MASEVLDLFCEFVRLPSPSGQERAVADHALGYLRDLGLVPSEDESGASFGSDSGNIHVALPPTAPGEPLFFCAHLDTVPPSDAIEPVVVDGVVRNAHPTILGADNKAAVAVMLEATRRLLAENRPHPGVELVLTPSEEVGLLGAFAFDQERLLARAGYVYDVDAAIGEVILGAPSAVQLEARFRGRAAHAGIAPEEGRSAIRAAALALAEMPLGRIDEETTANVGVIAGGSALNVVPEHCSLGGEARSHDERKLADQIQAMQDALSFAAGVSDCAVETTLRRSYSSYRFARDDLPVRLAAEALSRCGVEPSYSLTGGAADANVFNAGGRQCVNLGNGVLAIHTRDEHVAVGDLDLMVEVTLALIDAARG